MHASRLLILALLILVAVACSGTADDVAQQEPPAPATPAAAATAALAAMAPEEASLTSEQGAAMVEALRRGGYTLLFRHALTDLTQGDDLSALLLAGNEGASRSAIDGLRADCRTQRNLSQAGREQARMIGAEFERLAIPHQATLSSPFCRTQETAGLAFGKYRIEEGLSLIVGNDADGAATNAIRSLLMERPAAGTNVILVTHLSNITAAGLNLIGEGECVVIRPEGTRLMVVAYVKAGDWRRFP